MASTLTLVRTTPNSLRWAFVYDGAGGGGSGLQSVTAAALLALAQAADGASPLAAVLAASPTGVAFSNLVESGPCSLHICQQNPSANAVGAKLNGIGNRLDVAATDGVAGAAIVELRYDITPAR